MENKKILAIFATILLIVTLSAAKVNSRIHAQQPTSTNNGTVPSDLVLDLNLAQQNPAPDQQTIISSETKQAQVVTATGNTTTVTPQNIVAAEVKTESVNDAINPEQTTSEQVITVPVTIEVNDNGTPTPTSADNQPITSPGNQDNVTPTATSGDLVPGTTVVAPNDNAAPAEPSPEVSPSGTPQDQQNIPLESQTQSNPTPSDNSGSNPSGSEQQPQPTSSDNTGSVQGASTVSSIPWWQQLFNNIIKSFRQ